jgi:hypothetical protein
VLFSFNNRVAEYIFLADSALTTEKVLLLIDTSKSVKVAK